jgi:hypothetical protein
MTKAARDAANKYRNLIKAKLRALEIPWSEPTKGLKGGSGVGQTAWC